jgi:hypothetical protein
MHKKGGPLIASHAGDTVLVPVGNENDWLYLTNGVHIFATKWRVFVRFNNVRLLNDTAVVHAINILTFSK